MKLVGVDVSAKELVVKVAHEAQVLDKVWVFDNTPSGHKKLVKCLTKKTKQVRVCLEATGIYHFRCALFLSQQEGVEVMVAHPRAIRHFSQALMTRSKTDPLDADVILKYLQRMEFDAWVPPRQACLDLQAISRRIHQLKAEKGREKNRKHADAYTSRRDDLIGNDLEVNIRHLERRIHRLESKAVVLDSD